MAGEETKQILTDAAAAGALSPKERAGLGDWLKKGVSAAGKRAGGNSL